MKVFPATVIVPVRWLPEFAATVNAMVPLPEPETGLVSVIQLSAVDAVQAHPVPAVIVMDPLPPLLVKV